MKKPPFKCKPFKIIQERRMRVEMEKEVSELKEERRLLKRDRLRTENDLRQLLLQREPSDSADC